MLKNPNRKSKIHLNVLQQSEPDTIGLGLAVEQRFIELLDKWIQPPPIGRGEPLVPPASLDGAMKLWREMRIRHRQGDYRNTEDELRSTKLIAQWTLHAKAKLVGQDTKVVEWKD